MTQEPLPGLLFCGPAPGTAAAVLSGPVAAAGRVAVLAGAAAVLSVSVAAPLGNRRASTRT